MNGYHFSIQTVTMMTNDSAPGKDRFLFDSEKLQEIADERVIGQGLDHFRDNSVTDLELGENLLRAQVEDSDSKDTVVTEISYDGNGDLFVTCDIDVGEDALSHARHIAATTAHQLRAEKIRRHIAFSGGHLPDIQARLYSYQIEGVAFLAAPEGHWTTRRSGVFPTKPENSRSAVVRCNSISILSGTNPAYKCLGNFVQNDQEFSES